MKISYSGQTMLKGCEKRFYLEKVAKIPTDPDYQDDFEALKFGTAYHYVLEHSSRDHKKFSMDLLKKGLKEAGFDDFAREVEFKVYACLTSYYRLRKASGLKQIATEHKVGDENIVGYVDAILADDNGHWWLEDNKTSGWIQEDMFPRLPQDPQLNLYAAHIEEIAKTYNLDITKFMGVRYNVVAKPKHVVKKDDTLKGYAERSNPECYEIVIKKEDLNPAKAVKLILSSLEKAKSLTPETAEPNYSNCLNYNRPCPYWSQCHGKTYTQCKDSLQVFNRETMVDQTVLPPAQEELAADDPLLSEASEDELLFLM